MLYSYVPSLVKCRIFGVELVGLSKESIVSIERLTEVTTYRKALDGSRTAFNDPHGSYKVTFHIEQVSPSNDFLHTIFKLHQRSGLNLKIPLQIEEVSRKGGTQFTAFDVFFESEPSTEFGMETVPRDWTFICHNASYSISGTSDSGFLTKALSGTIRLIELAEISGIDLSGIEQLIGQGILDAEDKLKNLF